MPLPRQPSTRGVTDGADPVALVSVGDAGFGWLGAWLAGALVASAVAVSSGADTMAEAGPAWLLASAVAQWVPMVAVVWALGRRHGKGDLVADYNLRFRFIDLVGIPIGVFTQLVVLRLVYWPLRLAWPEAFSTEELEQRARDMYNSAHGAGVVLLILVVVVGAPLVEELTYRGLIQGALTRRLGGVFGLGLAAAWFALIHFQPVEYPGLFAAGLVFGACFLLTGRLGTAIVTHLAFNAAGLALVASS